MRANQRLINGAVSMILKVFRVGKDCKRESRWREKHDIQQYGFMSTIADVQRPQKLDKQQRDTTHHTPSDGWQQWDEHPSELATQLAAGASSKLHDEKIF